MDWIGKLADYGIGIGLTIIACLIIISLILEYLRRYAFIIIIVMIVGVLGSLYKVIAEEEKEPVDKPAHEYVESSESEDFILKNSNTNLLTIADVQELSKEELRLARNEIFARYGYIFRTDDLQQYFDRKSWYKPNEDFRDDMLSNIEKQNIELIKSYE